MQSDIIQYTEIMFRDCNYFVYVCHNLKLIRIKLLRYIT